MKIALYNVTTTFTTGGVETFVWEISRELARRGHTVDVIGGRGGIVREIPGVHVIQRPFIPRERFPNLGTRFRRLMERLSFGLHCRKDLVAGGYDWIYIQKPYDLPIAVWLKRRTGTRILLGLHGDDFFPGDRWLVHHVDRAVACSAFVREEARRRYGLVSTVVYNGVDTDVFYPDRPDQVLVPELGIGPGDEVLVFVGRLVLRKGLDVLLRSLHKLDRKNVLLLIIGDGPERHHLQQLSLDLGIRTVFTGSVEHYRVAAYYRLAIAAIFPILRDETFGIAIAEAMASGLPVVATRHGGIPELVEDKVTGLLVMPGDVGELAVAIDRILLDEAIRIALARASRARVEENFSWKAAVNRLMDAVGTDPT